MKRLKIGSTDKLGTEVAISLRSIENSYETEEKEWIKQLKKKHIKAAHPDDGWVNRTENYINFFYPYFRHTIKIGDLIVLGWHWNKNNRVVEVTKIKKTMFDLTNYYFKETNINFNDLMVSYSCDGFLNYKIIYKSKKLK